MRGVRGPLGGIRRARADTNKRLEVVAVLSNVHLRWPSRRHYQRGHEMYVPSLPWPGTTITTTWWTRTLALRQSRRRPRPTLEATQMWCGG
jgi:hypothetical protein